jgi:carbon-monoxide dehydrogenase large subunit
VSEDDLVWEVGKFSVKGAPEKTKTIQEIALAAYTNHPQGMEAGLEAVNYYDPPNLTFPFGSYVCVVDIDRGTGEVKIRRFVSIDDCGNIINPMVVQGQIHGGLTMGLAPALLEEISYDESGNIQGGSFIDYLLPTAMETPKWETDHRTRPPITRWGQGGRGVGHGGRSPRHRQRRGGRPGIRRAPRRYPDHASLVWKLLRRARRDREWFLRGGL